MSRRERCEGPDTGRALASVLILLVTVTFTEMHEGNLKLKLGWFFLDYTSFIQLCFNFFVV